MNRDENPISGPARRLPWHVSRFFEWSDARDLLSISRAIDSVTKSGTEPLLLTGALAFLSSVDVGDVLGNWAETSNNTFVQRLYPLAQALAAAFPDLPLPPKDQRIKDLLRGSLETGYLGAMLAVRQAPDLPEPQLDALNCLRLWVLVKALEYGRDGHIYDGNLQVACETIRSALDNSDPERRIWLSQLTRAQSSLPGFEDTLREVCAQRPVGETSKQRQTRLALHNITQGKRNRTTFEPSQAAQGELVVDSSVWDSLAGKSDSRTGGWPLALPAKGGGHFNHPEGIFQAVGVSPRDHPDRQSAKVRRMVLQSVEERQFLPCSWFSLQPYEVHCLRATLLGGLSSKVAETALASAFTAIALVTRNTLDTVGAIPLGSFIEPDWTLDLDAGQLRREPPRPQVRWRQTDQSAAWTRPLVQSWVFALSPTLLAVLRNALKHAPSASRLIDLWTLGASPYAAFRALCRQTPGLERISSQAIGLLGERLSYLETGDANFARVVMAPSSAGIAGAGSYASWTQKTAFDTLTSISHGLLTPISLTSDLEQNGLGSELDPDDVTLRDALAEAVNSLQGIADSKKWIEQHNRLTGFMVAALLACTGSRPTNSPFESILHFDLKGQRAYLEDKATAQMKGEQLGRVVPLPKVACMLINELYLPHLKHLGNQLQRGVGPLAMEILRQAEGLGSDKLPLFFFLRDKPSFAWLEVSESTLDELSGFRWPLPWNLFRHRMATRLREVGLDPELIDAQLGHAEVGSETFGDTSTRCWTEDEPAWLMALEQAINVLNIRVPNVSRIPKCEVQPAAGYRPFREAASFGRQARRMSRDRNREKAREQAHEDIRDQIGARPPESLTPEQWAEIGRSMLIQSGNRPHSNATIRYEAFEKYVGKLWRDRGLRVPLKQRFYRLPVPRTGHGPEALHAQSALAPLRRALDEVLRRPVSLQSVRNSGLLAALDLVLTSAVTDRSVVEAVASADASRIRLVVESRTPYIDYFEKPDSHGPHPARRFMLSAAAAGLFNKALRSKAKTYEREQESEDIRSLIRALPDSAQLGGRRALMDFALRWVELENSLTLPGLAAAVLAGRTLTYALPHQDWIRAKHGKRRVPSHALSIGQDTKINKAQTGPDLPESGSTDQEEDVAGSGLISVAGPTYLRNAGSETANRELLGKVRRLLRHLAGESVNLDEFSNLPATARLKNSNNESATRRAVRTIVRALIKNESLAASYSVRLLAAWAVDLLDRKSRRGGGKLRPRSILRYLSALSSGFMSYGRGVDLRLLSESQITDFYLNVIDSSLGAISSETTGDFAGDQSMETVLSGDASNNGLEDLTKDAISSKTTQAYVLERLVEFHRFASSLTELAEPDWSEIGDGLSASTVSTGFITPTEYLEALARICPEPVRSSAEDLICGFVLLLTYRFGLRGGEAISMGYPDWVEPMDAGGSIVVLVTATHSAVKTSGSRRQVPLMGELTGRERELVDTWLGYWQTETRSNTSIPLFFKDAKKGGILEIEPFRQRIVSVLRALTGSDNLTLHKARHSFANVVALYVLTPTSIERWAEVCFPAVATERTSREHALVVVGTHRNTRRRLWAVGRALGHSSPSTTCGSYLHLLGDWCAEIVAARYPERFKLRRTTKLEQGIDLDQWQDDSGYLAAEMVPVLQRPERAITPALAVEFMRSLARGATPETVGLRLNISHTESRRLLAAVQAVACQARNESPLLLSRGQELPYRLRFLQQVSLSRWDVLLEMASKLSSPLTEPSSNPIGQVAGSCQILAFRRGHFANIRDFLLATGFSMQDVRFFTPKPLDSNVQRWAQEFRFPLLDIKAEDGAKRFQLAAGQEFSADQPPTMWRDRISMVRSPANEAVISQAELAVLWTGYWSSYLSTE